MSSSEAALVARAEAPVGSRPARADPPGNHPDADEVLMRSIVADHYQSMIIVARLVVRDPALAEDVVQDSLLKVWRAWPTFRGESSRRSWVLRITHNTAVSTLRARRDTYVAPNDLHEAAGVTELFPERVVVGRAMVAGYGVALAKLDPLSRTIVIQRDLDGLSYAEIARGLGVALPTVKTRLFRARRLLATYLASWSESAAEGTETVPA